MTVPAVPPPGSRRIRAGDADREQVVEILRTCYVQGRLDLEEFTARVDTAYGAVYLDEFDALLADLPTALPHHPSRQRRSPPGRARVYPPVPLLVPLAVVAALFTAGALASGHPPFGLLWILILLVWLRRHPHAR